MTTDNLPVRTPVNRVEQIEQKLDKSVIGTIMPSESLGGVRFQNMLEVMEFAKLMAVSDVGVPKHLRGNPGACLAVCIYSLEWRMSPFAVANKSYSVNDRLSFEAAMFQAVVVRRAPIKGRVKMKFTGEGDTRVCKVWAELSDEPGEMVEYESPKFAKIQPKNSPLWRNDPDQQLFYFSVRAWSRRHFPDVMAGIYTNDELADNPDIVNQPPERGTAALVDRLKKQNGKGDMKEQVVVAGTVTTSPVQHQESEAAATSQAVSDAPTQETAPTPEPDAGPADDGEREHPDCQHNQRQNGFCMVCGKDMRILKDTQEAATEEQQDQQAAMTQWDILLINIKELCEVREVKEFDYKKAALKALSPKEAKNPEKLSKANCDYIFQSAKEGRGFFAMLEPKD